MECKGCGYPLWNLRSRECPECGKPFVPSEFEFAANNVAFCCPTCDQNYYGTSEQGHLVPRSFACVSCNRQIDMDEMILRPAAGLRDQETRAAQNPWVDRKRAGFFSGFFKTLWASLISPGQLMQATPLHTTGDAVRFALLILLLVSVIGNGILLLFMALPLMAMSSAAGGAVAFPMFSFLAVILLTMLVGPLVYVLLWGAVTHGLLRVGGGEPSSGIGRTYQALCYAQGPMIFAAIPCLNMYLFSPMWIWSTVAAILTVKEGQNVSGPRATAAVLALPVAMVVSLGGLFIFGMSMAISATQGFSTGGDAWVVGEVFERHAQAGTQPPEHVMEMVQVGDLSAWDLVLSDTTTLPEQVPLPNTTLEAWESMQYLDQQHVVQNALAALPSNNAPYRFGDFVFTHRGLDPQQHPQRWAAIGHASSRTNYYGSISTVEVVLMDGSVLPLAATAFDQARQNENAERAALGLPEIPNPTSLGEVHASTP